MKPGAIDELETQETEQELKRLLKGFTFKNFNPSNDHLQECLGLLDDLEDLTIQPDKGLVDDFKKALQKSYGEPLC